MTQQTNIIIGHDSGGDPVELDPSAIVSTRLMIQADSRQGKTSLLRLIAEGLLAQDRQVIVLDVEGEFATLRECGDVLVLGGDYGEAPIVPAAASKIGELLASTTASAVLDLLTMDPEDRDQFVGQLLDYWVRMPQKFWRPSSPRILLVDEVQELAPQSGKSESRPVIDKAMRLLAKRGFGVVPATQRLSSTSKGVVNVCRSNAVGPIAPKDAKDAADVLGIESRQRHELVRQEVGTFTVRGAVFGHAEPVQVQVNRPQTSPPDPGDAPVAKARRGGIGKLVKAMKALQTKAEAVDAGDEDAETIDGLKAQVADLRAKLADRPAVEADPAAVSMAIQRAVHDAKAEARRGVLSLLEGVRDQAEGVAEDSETTAALIRAACALLETEGETVASAATATPIAPAAKINLPTAAPPGDFTPNSTQQRILDALAWWESIGVTDPGNARIGVIAQVDHTGGYWSNTLGPLSVAGLVERGRGSTTLTPSGRSLATQPERSSTMKAYHDMLRKRFNGRTLDMLNAIINCGDHKLTTEQVGEMVGIDHTGGYFSNTIGPLGSFGLIDRGRGTVTPTRLLFPEGLR